MSAVYLTEDLFFSARVRHAAADCSLELKVVSRQSDLLAEVDSGHVHFVLLDFSTPGLDLLELVPQIREAASGPLSIVAFGPHVNVGAMAAAKQAGCDEVFTRGQFNSQMDAILRRHGCTV